MRDLDRKQRSLDLTSKSTRDRLEAVETKLYSGTVASPRELQDLGRELENVRRNLKEVDEQALENLVSLEETEQRVSQGEKELVRQEAAWSENQYGWRWSGANFGRVSGALNSSACRRPRG